VVAEAVAEVAEAAVDPKQEHQVPALFGNQVLFHSVAIAGSPLLVLTQLYRLAGPLIPQAVTTVY
jgi:hypothetical protein